MNESALPAGAIVYPFAGFTFLNALSIALDASLNPFPSDKFASTVTIWNPFFLATDDGPSTSSILAISLNLTNTSLLFFISKSSILSVEFLNCSSSWTVTSKLLFPSVISIGAIPNIDILSIVAISVTFIL